MAKFKPNNLCPCESGKPYSGCCEPYHLGGSLGVFAPTAEALMRSRYTAYALRLEDYLLQTWHPATRPEHLDLNDGATIKWLSLEIKKFELLSDTSAIVAFIARYKINGKAEKMVETSLFELTGGRWYYLNGDVTSEIK